MTSGRAWQSPSYSRRYTRGEAVDTLPVPPSWRGGETTQGDNQTLRCSLKSRGGKRLGPYQNRPDSEQRRLAYPQCRAVVRLPCECGPETSQTGRLKMQQTPFSARSATFDSDFSKKWAVTTIDPRRILAT